MNDSDNQNVVDMEAKRESMNQQQDDSGETKKNKPTPEYHWGLELKKKNEFGVEEQHRGHTLYNFDRSKRCWIPCASGDIIKSKVLRFLDSNMPKQKTLKSIKSCAEMTLLETILYGRKLVKDKRFIISTNDNILEMDDTGKINAYWKDDLFFQGKEYFTRIHIDINLGQVGRTYTPQSTEDIERKDTLFSMLIKSALPDVNLRRVAQEFMGDTLHPKQRKALLLFVGERNGGKSQLLDIIQKLHMNSVAGNLANLQKFGMAQFPGSSFVAVDEMPEFIDEAILKNIVGGAVCQVTIPYVGPVSVVPDWKIGAACNAMPRIRDRSGAVEARLYPFPIAGNKTGKKVEELASEIMKNDLKDVLDWFLNGAAAVVRRGRILTQDELPEVCKKELEKSLASTNPGLIWMREVELVPCKKSLVSKRDVYKNFVQWCMENGHQNFAKMSTNIWAREVFYPAMKSVHGDAYDASYERRARVGTGRYAQRLECYPVRFKNDPQTHEAAALGEYEVDRSLMDVSSYFRDGKIPSDILEVVSMTDKDMDKLNDEQRCQVYESKMLSQGYVKSDDGWWEKDA